MKKILLVFLVLTIGFSAFSQRRSQKIKWFSFALKGGFGNSVLLNNDVLKDKNVTLDYATTSFSYGGRFTFSYGDNHGFGIEGLMSSFGQNYDIDNGGSKYQKSIDIKSTDILLFYRYSGDGGGYFEIGPKFSSIKTVVENIPLSSSMPPAIQDYYSSRFTSAFLGFGMSVLRLERLNINTGVRLAYSLTDINPNKNYYVLNDKFYHASYPIEATTNPFSAQVIVEVNYFFAFYGDAKCGRGRLMFFQ